MTEEELLYINGVDAATGEPLLPALPIADLVAIIKGEPVDVEKNRIVKAVAQTQTKKSLGLPDDISPMDVKKAGWAVVFHKDEDEDVKKAVLRLYEHRRAQIGDETRVKVLEYAGETDWLNWLAKYQVSSGSVKPWRVPYYLLLAGGPTRFSFDFCQMLALEYAVGLLHFDKPDPADPTQYVADAAAYGRYVDSVIAYEKGDAPPRSKEAVFFRTNRDRATKLSAEHLIAPLADGVPAQGDEPAQAAVAESKGFTTRRIWDDAASEAKMAEIFSPGVANLPPAFLFSATHGAGFMQPDPQQHALQGALKCQDDKQFSAELLANMADVRVHGLIAFLFACYSAGTPQYDQYITRTDHKPLQIAEQPFLAALPKALLSHPQGGALACIGHIERAWNYSFSTNRLGDQLIPYQNAVRRILGGVPVGYALTDMRQRYASLATSVAKALEDLKKFGIPVDDKKLVADWSARNDAGGYVVIGDPAICIRT